MVAVQRFYGAIIVRSCEAYRLFVEATVRPYLRSPSWCT